MLLRFPPTRAMLVAVALSSSVGCAHAAEEKAAKDQQIDALKTRLEESERLNGRLAVRIEELEDSVFLLQDRVEANRIALQRRGIMGTPGYAQNQHQAPRPAPETYYYQNSPSEQYQQERHHPVTRIPLGGAQNTTRPTAEAGAEQVPTSQVPTSGAGQDEIVITEDEFREFERTYAAGKDNASSGASSSSSSRTKRAQPPVTDEKLPTTGELEAKPSAPETSKDALGLYKDGLASYRSGEYAQALARFEAFLEANPQPDYVDNALYWIGECHYGLGDMDKSLAYFQRVMQEQPDGNKVPDAMLKMSLAFDRLGKAAEATKLLEDLARHYPATNAGRLGKQKLEQRTK